MTSFELQRYRDNKFMMGVVNRYWKEIVRSKDHMFNKW